MRRIKLSRWRLLAALTVAVAALAACGGSSGTSGPATTTQALDPVATATPTATQAAGPALDLAPQLLNLELQGEGPEVVGPITVDTGVMIVFIRYEGDAPSQ